MHKFEAAALALAADSIDGKLAAIALLQQAVAVSPAPTFKETQNLSSPTRQWVVGRGIPSRPVRVAPRQLASRKGLDDIGSRAALIHAVAHIEYSAIDLALDHALRFAGMPERYYADWFGVAIDEARHFCLLRKHLCTLGFDYGDFPVHDSLWEMAEKTAHDCLTRMALVPRLLEARGLDATPPIQRKLAAVGDHEATRILAIILHDEEGHVSLGDHWFRFLCDATGCEPEETYKRLIREYCAPWPQKPLNASARLAAGFSQAELDDLTKGPPRE